MIHPMKSYHPLKRLHSTCILLFTILIGSLLLVVDGGRGSSELPPHPHTGVVKPFTLGDPGVKLNNKAIQTLQSGKPYKTQIQDGTSGRGLVVQDVNAPVHIVWDKILDFDKYNKMVPKTIESKIYKQENINNQQQRIWVKMKIGFPIIKLTFYINHLYDPKLNTLIWTLDYSKKSDLNDSVGYWYVIPHPDNPTTMTRVYYSVDVSMYSWVPQFVIDFMSKQALIDATTWVKKFSELEYKNHNPTTAAAADGKTVTTTTVTNNIPTTTTNKNKKLKNHRRKRDIFRKLFQHRKWKKDTNVCNSQERQEEEERINNNNITDDDITCNNVVDQVVEAVIANNDDVIVWYKSRIAITIQLIIILVLCGFIVLA